MSKEMIELPAAITLPEMPPDWLWSIGKMNIGDGSGYVGPVAFVWLPSVTAVSGRGEIYDEALNNAVEAMKKRMEKNNGKF